MAQVWIQNAKIRPIYEDVSNSNSEKIDQKYHDDETLRKKLSTLIDKTLKELEQKDLDNISKKFPEFKI